MLYTMIECTFLSDFLERELVGVGGGEVAMGGGVGESVTYGQGMLLDDSVGAFLFL